MNAMPDNDIEKDLSDELAKDFPNAPHLRHEPVPLTVAVKPHVVTPANKGDEIERYLSHVSGLIAVIRKRMVDAEAAHMRERAQLMQQVTDQVRNMDGEHAQRMGRLKGMLAKLEAARDA